MNIHTKMIKTKPKSGVDSSNKLVSFVSIIYARNHKVTYLSKSTVHAGNMVSVGELCFNFEDR